MDQQFKAQVPMLARGKTGVFRLGAPWRSPRPFVRRALAPALADDIRREPFPVRALLLDHLLADIYPEKLGQGILRGAMAGVNCKKIQFTGIILPVTDCGDEPYGKFAPHHRTEGQRP